MKDLKQPNTSGTETLWLIRGSEAYPPYHPVFIQARLWYDARMMARTYLARFEYFDMVVVKAWDKALPVKHVMVSTEG